MPGAGCLDNFLGPINRATVYHEDLLRPALERVEAETNVGFLILGNDQDVNHAISKSGNRRAITVPQDANRYLESRECSFAAVLESPT